MSKLKIIKKILLVCIIISIIVLFNKFFTKYVRAASETKSIFWNVNQNGNGDSAHKKAENLLFSKDLYCIEHGAHLSALRTFNKKGTVIWTSGEESSQYYRKLAKILYEGKKTGNGGYNHYSKYQLALWMLIYDNGDIGKNWVYSVKRNNNNEITNKSTITLAVGNPREKYSSLSKIEKAAITETNWNKNKAAAEDYLKEVNEKTKNSVFFTGYTSKDKIIKPDGSIIEKKGTSITFDGNGSKGYFELASLRKGTTITSLEVTFKDKSEPVTITKDNYNNNNWVKIYDDKNNVISPVLITEKKKIYIENLNSNYVITKVKVNAKMPGQGYAVEINTWEYVWKGKIKGKTVSKVQHTINTVNYGGMDLTGYVEFTVTEPKGSIKIEKKGQHNETDLVANYKLYCVNTKKYVSGDANKDKTYTNEFKDATTYKSGQTISNLLTKYTYKLVEVSIVESGNNWKYYSNPVVMNVVTSNLQTEGMNIEKTTVDGNNYTCTSEIKVYLTQTNELKVENKETHKDLTIIKKDSANPQKKLSGAIMKVYIKGKGWLKGKDGKYTYESSIDNGDGYVTDQNGKIELALLAVDEYHVYETKAPQGYVLKDQYKEELANLDPNKYKQSDADKIVYLGSRNLNVDDRKIEYEVDNTIKGALQIKKVPSNKQSTQVVDGAKMAIYYVGKDAKGNDIKGWLSYNNVNQKIEYKYNSSITERTTFETGTSNITESSDKNAKIPGTISIKGLNVGRYYVYETAVPEGYDLEDQKGYRNNNSNNKETKDDYKTNIFSEENSWVYVGYKDLTDTTTNLYFEIPNDSLIKLNITKLNDIDNSFVKGAQMKIYSVSKSDPNDKGWIVLQKKVNNEYQAIKGEDNAITGSISLYGQNKNSKEDNILAYYNISNPNNATTFETDGNGNITIEGLRRNRTYYVYETAVPQDADNLVTYDLKEQSGYNAEYPKDPIVIEEKADGTKTTISQKYKYAYLEPENYVENQEDTVEYTLINTPELELTVTKKDQAGNLVNDVGIKFYVDGKGWLKGPNQKGDYSFEESAKNATTYTTGYKYGTKESNGTISVKSAGEKGKIVINGLKRGIYHAYEISAPTTIKLYQQEGYMSKSAPKKDNDIGENGWVYLGSKDLTQKVKGENEHKYYVTWEQTDSVKITIEKKLKTSDTESVVFSNVGMKLFYIDEEEPIHTDTYGYWIQEVKENNETHYKYIKDLNNATEFMTDSNGKITLNGLKRGKYYVYETSIKNDSGISLKIQDDKSEEFDFIPRLNESKGWVCLGEIDTTKKNDDGKLIYEFKDTYYNKFRNLEIDKKDKDTGAPLKGAKMIIHYQNSNNTVNGWVVQNANGEYTYNNSLSTAKNNAFITNDGGKIVLKNIEIGRYDVYEIATSSQDIYPIEIQNGYHDDRDAAGCEDFDNNDPWVHLQLISNEDSYTYAYIPVLKDDEGNIIYTAQNKLPGKGTLKIIKTDVSEHENVNGVGIIVKNISNGKFLANEQGTAYADQKNDAYIFYTKKINGEDGVVLIQNLVEGTKYHAYEVSVPDDFGVELKDQPKYVQSEGWVPFDKDVTIEVNGNNNITELQQYNYSRIEPVPIVIRKYDESTNKYVNDFKFKIYKKDSGWLKADSEGKEALKGIGGKLDLTDSFDNAGIFITRNTGTLLNKKDGTIELEVDPGTYEIYEVGVSADSNIKLEEQPGYIEDINIENGAYNYVYAGDAVAGLNNSDNPIIQINYEYGDLKIIKIDNNTGEKLDGAKFIIYRKDKGWLGKDSNGNWTYNNTINHDVELTNQAVQQYSIFTTGDKKNISIDNISDEEAKGIIYLKDLEIDTYYAYEIETPTGFELGKQEGYKIHNDYCGNSFKSEEKFVYGGNGKVEANKTIELKVENRPDTNNLKIVKVNNKGKILPGAEIRIFYVNPAGTERGWLSGKKAGEYNYKNNLKTEVEPGVYVYTSNTVYKTTNREDAIYLKDVKLGTYFIYETKTPSEYPIKFQPGYQDKIGNGYCGNAFTLSDDPNAKSDKFAYLGKATVDGMENTTSKYVNNLSYINITINKKDENGKPLEGAKFVIFYENEDNDVRVAGWLSGKSTKENIDEDKDEYEYKHDNLLKVNGNINPNIIYTTDANGKIELKNLREGTYTVFEIETSDPEKYVLSHQNPDKYKKGKEYCDIDNTFDDGDEYLFTDSKACVTDKDNQHITYEFNEENVPEKVDLTIVKEVNDDIEDKLPGTGMKLYYEDGKNIKGWLVQTKTTDSSRKTIYKYTLEENASDVSEFKTDSNGEIILQNVPVGNYYVYETTSSDETKYPLASQNGYRVKSEGSDSFGSTPFVFLGTPTVESDNNSKLGYKVYAYNTEPLDLTVIKEDEVTGNRLAGADFAFYFDGKLRSGKEVKGYIKGTDGNYTFIPKASENVIPNDAGIYTTDVNGSITFKEIDILQGNIIAYEIKASVGYVLSEQEGYNKDIKYKEFTGAAVNKKTISTTETVIRVKNKSTTNLEIIKADKNDPNKILNGAQMKIYYESLDGNEKGFVYKNDSGYLYNGDANSNNTIFTTGTDGAQSNDGKIVLKGLKSGNYYIYESKAPDGYSLEELKKNNSKDTKGYANKNGWAYIDVKKLTTQSEIAPIKVLNSPVSLTITKVDKDNKNLKINGVGMKIQFTDKNGNTEWLENGKEFITGTDGIEQGDGKIYISPAKEGKYNIYETSAPGEIGYFLEKQEGYDSTNKWLYLGNVEVKKEDNKFTYTEIYDNERFGNLDIYKIGENKERLNGAEIKLYYISLDGKTKKWVGAKDSNGKYTLVDSSSTAKVFKTGTDVEFDNDTNAKKVGRVALKGVKLGTYYIVETKAPEGYALFNPEAPEVPSDVEAVKNYINENINSSLYLGNLKLENNGATAQIPYISANYTNIKNISLEIIKIDPDAPEDMEKVNGAEIKLYAKYQNGTYKWVGEKNADGKYTMVDKQDNAKIFVTGTDVEDAKDKNGRIYIEKLDVADYYAYEVKAPKGYDITKQKGYMNKNNDGNKDPNTIQNNITISEQNKWVYLGERKANDYKIPLSVENRKIVSSLSGFVWEEKYLDNKGLNNNKFNHIYDTNDEDKKVNGVIVNLYIDGVDDPVASVLTDNEGKYEFKEKTIDGQKDYITYWDLENAYVEFEYNNDTFVVVDPFIIGRDAEGNLIKNPKENYANNSKAQEHLMEKPESGSLNNEDDINELDDTDIEKFNDNVQKQMKEQEQYKNKNIENSGAGSAVTYLGEGSVPEGEPEGCPLTQYYNEEDYKVTNINLGLIRKKDPEYSITENVAYVKIKKNGFTYLYNYSGNTTESNYVPQVQIAYQNGYGHKLYPSDIVEHKENVTNENYEVYVVYSVSIKNLTTLNIDDLYVENKLYLSELTQEYDKDYYELNMSKESIEKDQYTNQFALWSEKDGTLKYNLKDNKNVFKDGINGDETKTTYIQFRLKDEIIKEKIFKGEDPIITPQINSIGYHEYLRTDNVWNYEESEKVYCYDGRTIDSFVKNENTKKYFAHKSKLLPKHNKAYFITFSIGEKQRTISGVAFEDNDIDEDPSKKIYEKENLGNGIMDNSELNRAKDVKVELLKPNYEVAELYSIVKENGNNKTDVSKAEIKTNKFGKYEFVGVVPGYYYIRFTYGDGSQKIYAVSADGNSSTEIENSSIKSSDYKSTIINTKTGEAGNTIKDAMEFSYPKSVEENREKGSWYKALNNTNYSTAVDDITNDNDYSRYKNNSGVAEFDNTTTSKNINAYTPIVGISIENDNNDTSEDGGFQSEGKYEGFNLGLIKQIHEVLIEKSITNVDFTSQIGSKIVSDNPATSDSKYIKYNPGINSEIDKPDTTKLAQDVAIETEPEFIYGSSVKTTYKVAVKNNSPKDFIEDEGNEHYGYYYKYGISTYAHPKTIKLEIKDFIDKKYRCDNDNPVIIEAEEGKTQYVNISNPDTYKGSNNTYKDKKYILISGWGKDNSGNVKGLASGEKDYIKYSLSGLVGDLENDTNYENIAQITKIEVDKLTTIESGFDWKASDARLVIYPDTGENRSYTYLIVGIVSLATLAIGFVLIKKKVLK